MSGYNGMELQLQYQTAEKKFRAGSLYPVGIKVMFFWDMFSTWVPTFHRNPLLPYPTIKKEASRFLQKFGTHQPNYMSSHARRR